MSGRGAIIAAKRIARAAHRTADRGIDRCPSCGAWRYLAKCWTPLPDCSGEQQTAPPRGA